MYLTLIVSPSTALSNVTSTNSFLSFSLDLSAVFSLVDSFCSVFFSTSVDACGVSFSVLTFSESFELQAANDKLKVNAVKPNNTLFNFISPY
ncbi:hypothetical protein PT2222_140043 [Paraburkholderia tropica]